jgi:hypothetical protein
MPSDQLFPFVSLDECFDTTNSVAGDVLIHCFVLSPCHFYSILVLSVLGAGLIVFSVAAFRNASAREPEIDRALSATLKSLEKVAATPGFSKMLALPLQFLVACKDAVVSVVMLPFKFVLGSVSTVVRAGGATMQAVNSIIRWFVGIPGNLASSVMTFLGRGTRAMSNGVSNRSQRAVGAVSASFLGVFVRSVASSFTYTATMVKASFSSIGLALVQVKGSIESASMATINFGSSVVATTSGVFVAVETGLAGTALALGKADDRVSKGLSGGTSALNGMGDKVTEFLSKIVASISSPFGGSMQA